MNALLEQVVALNYATTPLEATHAHVTLATHLMLTTKHAVVSVDIYSSAVSCLIINMNHTCANKMILII